MKPTGLILTIILLMCLVAAAQEPPTGKTRPTLTNEDTRLERAATLAAKQQTTGKEIISRLEQTQSFRCHFISIREFRDFVLEIVAPSSLHMITLGGIRKGDESIFVDGSVYERVSDAREWIQHAAKEATTVQKTMQSLMPWLLPLQLRSQGSEILDGAHALVYESEPTSEKAKQIYVTVWLRFDDGLPLKLLVNENSHKEKQLPLYAVTFYDYNESIKIEPPAKVTK